MPNQAKQTNVGLDLVASDLSLGIQGPRTVANGQAIEFQDKDDTLTPIRAADPAGSTDVATKAYVDGEIATVIGTATVLGDTLGELEAAIAAGDASTVTTILAFVNGNGSREADLTHANADTAGNEVAVSVGGTLAGGAKPTVAYVKIDTVFDGDGVLKIGHSSDDDAYGSIALNGLGVGVHKIPFGAENYDLLGSSVNVEAIITYTSTQPTAGDLTVTLESSLNVS